jgi:zinc transporter, ZIP family
MSSAETIALGLLAGGTIFLGLPIARLKNPPRILQGFLNAVATGILFFLLYDVLQQAIGPVNHAVNHGSRGTFAEYLVVLLAGLTVGLLALVLFEQRFLRREPGAAPSGPALGYMIATGIGMHNFSEGLAIGQSATQGAVQLAVLLIIGFGLHNTTEGFGIVGPMAGEPELPSWGFLGAMGLIGGGPTFVGTVVGQAWVSPALATLFFSAAGGSILYVVVQLFEVVRRFAMPTLVGWMLLIGLLLGFGTDWVLVAAGV